MSDLNIIYVPETSDFRDGGVLGICSVQNNESAALLREKYKKIKETFPWLPKELGIASHNLLFKAFAKRDADKIENRTTSYLPLDLLERALKVRTEDFSDSLSRECAYRTISSLIIHPAISMNDDLTNTMGNLVPYCAAIPHLEGAIDISKQCTQEIKNEEILSYLKSISEHIESLPRWELLQNIYNHVLKTFEANKVSRDFPLNFYPSKIYFPELFSVKLEDRLETPEYLREVENGIKDNLRILGFKDIPAEFAEQLRMLQKDFFGETRRVETNLELLLETLPAPKTILTDTYIVDIFPQLKAMNFETFEYRD